MKAAVAVLGASLLFFLGVLTGAGRRESVPPPVAIPLGVVDSATADGGSPAPPPSSPAAPAVGTENTATTRKPTAPASSTPPAPASPPPSAPAGRTDPGGSTGTPASTPPPATDASTTSTTLPPGQVEKVDNQVDCAPAGKKGKGPKDPCPSSTATTQPAGGGRGGR